MHERCNKPKKIFCYALLTKSGISFIMFVNSRQGGKMIKVAIVDDEKNEQIALRRLIERYADETGTAFSVECFNGGVHFIDKYTPVDLVLTDINMGSLNGVETCKQLRIKDPEVIIVFITNYSGYALQGYSVHAFDFLIKPVSYDIFSILMKKVIGILEKRGDEKYVTLKGDGVSRIKLSDIYYIEITGHKRVYHTTNGDLFDWGQLNDLEKELSEYGFSRCHASYLVNLKYVRKIDGLELYIGKTVIPISRVKRKPFIDSVSEYMKRGAE